MSDALAVVVGIDHYPDAALGRLQGAVNDAEEFCAWHGVDCGECGCHQVDHLDERGSREQPHHVCRENHDAGPNHGADDDGGRTHEA